MGLEVNPNPDTRKWLITGEHPVPWMSLLLKVAVGQQTAEKNIIYVYQPVHLASNSPIWASVSWCCWGGSEARKHPTVQTCLLPVCCQMFETAMRWRCSQASASSCHKRTTLCLMCEWEVFLYKLTYFTLYLFCFNDALDLHHHLHPPLLFLWKGAFYPEL